jgi:aspartate oxidase
VSEKIYLTGNTYPVKDDLKKIGCGFDGDRKQWFATSQEVAKEAEKIIKKGVSSVKTGTKLNRPLFYKCQVCGVAASKYVRIYGSGECRDCLEERCMGY